MFSFGIVLWEILTGEEPYADMHYGAIIGNTYSPYIWLNERKMFVNGILTLGYGKNDLKSLKTSLHC